MSRFLRLFPTRARRWNPAQLVTACLVGCSMVLGPTAVEAQDLPGEANLDVDPTAPDEGEEAPAIVPRQESVTIEPYTGPPIFLPEPPTPPRATRVEAKTVTDYYDPDEEEQPRVRRTVVRYSDDSLQNDGDYQEFYRDGQLFVSGQFDEGVPVGEWTYYHPDGTVAKNLTFNDGKPDGPVELRNAEGQVIAKREFADGNRVGEWVRYDDSGEQPLLESTYADGKPDGVWQIWHPNGNKRQQIPFVDGQRHGTVIEWDEQGTKRAEASFVEGKRDGITRVWNDDGRQYEQQFDEGRLVSTEEVEN